MTCTATIFSFADACICTWTQQSSVSNEMCYGLFVLEALRFEKLHITTYSWPPQEGSTLRWTQVVSLSGWLWCWNNLITQNTTFLITHFVLVPQQVQINQSMHITWARWEHWSRQFTRFQIWWTNEHTGRTAINFWEIQNVLRKHWKRVLQLWRTKTQIQIHVCSHSKRYTSLKFQPQPTAEASVPNNPIFGSQCHFCQSFQGRDSAQDMRWGAPRGFLASPRQSVLCGHDSFISLCFWCCWLCLLQSTVKSQTDGQSV